MVCKSIPKCCGVSKSHEITSEEDSNYGDENVERGNWSGKLDFILSLIGYAVGMSNIWRFPILCYRNGGGAFLIPYVIFMMLCGMPLFFLEVAFGQFCSEGPITAWKVCRLFRGAGYAMIIITGLTTIYYNVLIMYILYYFIASFTAIPGVPWSECNNEWNTPACAIVQDHANITNNNTLLVNTSYINYSRTDVNASFMVTLTNTSFLQPVTPAEEFWNNHVLGLTDGIGDLGAVHWDLALILLLTWLVIFMCLIRGIKTSGKVVYVTATFPYIVITILILRGVTLPGSLNGLKFFFIPRWELLASAKVWSDAATQVFFSLGPSWGGLLTMASYNKFHNNCLRDSVLVPIVNGATSIYCGIAVFSILGFLSKETGVELDKVVQAGPGLVFVVYPEALSRIPLSAFWSALFFLMMFTVCLDSQFVMVENVCSAFIDNFPKLLRPKKSLFVLFVCMVSYVLGLPMTTSGGNYIMHLLDWFISYIGLMVIALIECLIFVVLYGINNFYDDIYMMLQREMSIWWKLCWAVITPLIIVFILIMIGIGYVPIYLGDYVYPSWAEAIGWIIASSSVAMIPLWMVVEYFTSSEGDTFVKRVQSLIKPTDDWGPALEQFRTGRYALKASSNKIELQEKNQPLMSVDM